MTESEVQQVEEELGDLPSVYRSFLLSLPSEFDKETEKRVWSIAGHIYLCPQKLLRDNLALLDGDSWLAGTEWSEVELEDYLVIGGDGCGNYYIVEQDDDESPVYLLAHDPVELGFRFESIQEYCDALVHAISD